MSYKYIELDIPSLGMAVTCCDEESAASMCVTSLTGVKPVGGEVSVFWSLFAETGGRNQQAIPAATAYRYAVVPASEVTAGTDAPRATSFQIPSTDAWIYNGTDTPVHVTLAIKVRRYRNT